MEKSNSRAQLEMCESAEYDLSTGRFSSHGVRRSNHCGPRTKRVALVILVILLLIIIGFLMAMFGPGNTDLVYKTAKLEDPHKEGKTAEPPTEVATRHTTTAGNGEQSGSPTPNQTTPAAQNGSTAAPTSACATPGPTSPPATPDVTCDVAIVGAGLAGLYMANKLTTTTSSVCVLEKNARVGGRIFDDHFSAAPNASVGLGAWGMESNGQPYMTHTLSGDFKIETQSLFSDHLGLHRARGITVAKAAGSDISSLCDALRTQAFSSLRQHPYTNETCESLFARVSIDEIYATVNFSTAGTYLSNFLTSEGSKLISEFYGVNSDYLHLIRPTEYIEFLKGRLDELRASDGYYRPTRGMSGFVRSLTTSAVNSAVFLDNAVSSINSAAGQRFHLQTNKHLVSAEKVVLALPPVALAKIKGDVTEQITRHAIFRSIVSVPAFKAAAVYRDAWWEDTLQAQKTFTSYDSCLGTTMPHKTRGDNGEAILYTAYAHGACAEKWGVLAKQQGQVRLESAMQRALAEKFENDTIPRPLQTKYKYWEDGALHFQKAGSNFTKQQVLSWAAKPVAGKAVFLAGDAYYNYGYVCEHALKSTATLLQREWNISLPKELFGS